MTEKTFLQYREKAITIFGGQLPNKDSYTLFKKVVEYLVIRGYYIITGGLSIKGSIMYEPIKISDNRVVTVYSADDKTTNPHLVITPRRLSFTAKNFGDQMYLMVQAPAVIIFDGGLSTLTEMTLALDFWKRHPKMHPKNPIFFFGHKWLSYREIMIEDELINVKDVRQSFLYCKGFNRFRKHFEGVFPA